MAASNKTESVRIDKSIVSKVRKKGKKHGPDYRWLFCCVCRQRIKTKESMNYIYEIAGRKINLSQLCWIDDTSYIEFGRVDFGFCMKDNGLPVSDSSVMVLSFSPTGQEMTHKPCKIYSRVDGLYREDGSISWNADGGDHPYPITGDTLFEKRIKEEVGFLVVQWNLVQQDINSRQVS